MSCQADATPTGPLRRVMRGRDPREEHRASTPLELLFDLTFVVAVSQAASQFHHALAEDHVGSGLAAYASVFFAIWWAWMNFTWFASAYDTDDVPYRLLTLLQMAGVLVLASGVAAVFEDGDFTLVVAGYVVMRLAMVAQWLRAAIEHPEGRSGALHYAAGITVVQMCWVARLWAPDAWAWATFLVLVAAELAVPAWAEYRGHPTSWHPGHIAERYSLFTIIVLGEVILGSLAAVRSAVADHGLSAPVLLIGDRRPAARLRPVVDLLHRKRIQTDHAAHRIGLGIWPLRGLRRAGRDRRGPGGGSGSRRTPRTPLRPKCRTGGRRPRGDRAPDARSPAPGHPHRSGGTRPAGSRRCARGADSGLQRSRPGNRRIRPGHGLGGGRHADSQPPHCPPSSREALRCAWT